MDDLRRVTDADVVVQGVIASCLRELSEAIAQMDDFSKEQLSELLLKRAKVHADAAARFRRAKAEDA